MGVPEEYGPGFYPYPRAPMAHWGPTGYPIPYYREPGSIDPNMTPMLYDNLTMDQPFPHYYPMPFTSYPYYIEQVNQNTTVYNNMQNQLNKAGKPNSKSINQKPDQSPKKQCSSKSTAKTDCEDDSHTLETKDSTKSRDKESKHEESMNAENINDMVRELVEVSPYYSKLNKLFLL